MYILKNALTSIFRNKGRNLLIGIIILVISSSTAVSLAINNSSSKLIESYEAKYDTLATISMNRDNMMKDFNPGDRENSKENMREMFSKANSISVSDIENYADSKLVKSYYYTMQVGVNGSGIEKAEMSSNNDGNFPGFPGGRGRDEFRGQSSGDFTLKGYSSIEAMNEFIEGSYTITDGEVSDDFDEDNCIINSELATLNDISVGDTITVVDSNNESLTYNLVVTGIYKEKTDDNNNMNMFANSVNTIITNCNVINKMVSANSSLSVSTSPTFILTSRDVVEDFESELKDKGLSENLAVQTNLDQVDGATSTISNVKSFAVTFLILTLIIGTVVLLVINMINIRERKYEIGVLRTIGMKKSKVCLQFIYELLIVSCVALLVGAGIGAVLSVPISNNLLQSEISSSEAENENIRENFGRGGPDQNGGPGGPGGVEKFQDKGFRGVAQVQAFDSIDAVVDFKVLIELLAIGLVITLISGASAMISIQRFSPLTILKERS